MFDVINFSLTNGIFELAATLPSSDQVTQPQTITSLFLLSMKIKKFSLQVCSSRKFFITNSPFMCPFLLLIENKIAVCCVPLLQQISKSFNLLLETV